MLLEILNMVGFYICLAPLALWAFNCCPGDCEPGTGTATSVTCEDCAILLPSVINLSIPVGALTGTGTGSGYGIWNKLCLFCNDYEGDYALLNSGTSDICGWETAEIQSNCVGGVPNVPLWSFGVSYEQLNSGAFNYTAALFGAGVVAYQPIRDPSSPFGLDRILDCNGTTTFELDLTNPSTLNDCGGWPPILEFDTNTGIFAIP